MAGNNPSSKEVVSLTDSIDREPDERQPTGGQGHITSIEDPEETRLNRVITRPMLTFFILGDILGGGIYSLTGRRRRQRGALLVLRRDRVGHQHFTAPRFLPFVGAAVGLVFLLPIDRTAEIYRTAVLLLLGGLALWAVNFLVTRRTGTVVAEQDLTIGPGDDDRP